MSNELSKAHQQNMRNKITFQHFLMCQRKQLFYKSLVNRKFFSVRLIKRISRNVAKSGSGMSFNTLFEDVFLLQVLSIDVQN